MTQAELWDGWDFQTYGVRARRERVVNEIKARDEALDRLEGTRRELIEVASEMARNLCELRGSVTSTEVAITMRGIGWGSEMDAVDPRWLGAVFRRGWKRIGYEATGSHGRPVARWTKA